MAGVNFRTDDGVVHAQDMARTVDVQHDNTSCGLVVITNNAYVFKHLHPDKPNAACTTERVTCALCLGA